jgi:hypothetical protein
MCLTMEKDAKDFEGRIVELLVDDEGEHYESFQGPVRPVMHKLLNSFIVDSDMAGYVQVYVDYVRDLVASTGGDLFVEVPVPLVHLTDEEDAQGTSDAVIIAGSEIIVVDLKYGRGVEVSAEANEQLLMYASGALRSIGKMLGGDFKTVRVAISQPRVSALPSEWSCTVDELVEFESRVLDAAITSREMLKGRQPVSLSPSDDACRFCKAATEHTCPAFDAFVVESIGADFDEVITGPKLEVQESDLSKHMAAVDMIEDWCKAVRAKVESELLSGHEVEGYKLVQGRKGARAWSSEEEAESTLKSMRLKVEEMYDFSLISPTSAEKLAKEGKIGKRQWPRVVELITQSEGKPSVAPEADKRPALVVSPTVDDFDVIG